MYLCCVKFIKNIIKKYKSSLIREQAEIILSTVHKDRGMLYEDINEFRLQLEDIEGMAVNGTKEHEELFPTKHDLKDGLYTREVSMPQGSLVVSYIHKQNHPSFFLKGEMSILTDTGEVERIKAPMKVMTELGTQRVAYMHSDVTWVCVYKTDAKTIEEAEKEVYTTDFRKLPSSIIKKQLCQE